LVLFAAILPKRTERIFSHKIPRVNRVAEDVDPYEGGSKRTETIFSHKIQTVQGKIKSPQPNVQPMHDDAD
jgi:hypothetical protein